MKRARRPALTTQILTGDERPADPRAALADDMLLAIMHYAPSDEDAALFAMDLLLCVIGNCAKGPDGAGKALDVALEILAQSRARLMAGVALRIRVDASLSREAGHA